MAQSEELGWCYSPALIYDSDEQQIIHKAAECARWESGTFTINDQETGPLADGPLHHRDIWGTAGKFKELMWWKSWETETEVMGSLDSKQK